MSGVVYVEGIALWSGRLPGWERARAILRGDADPPDEPAPRPSPTVLAATERRRAPDSVAVALDAASAACASAGREPNALPSVFASTHGDLGISDYMCATLAKTPSLISPIRFHNSVHNAAAGYWTIGAGCMEPYTALSAWRHTFGMALLEAFTQVAIDGVPVLVVAYDIEARGPMATVVESRSPVGAGLVLAPARTERSRCVLAWQTSVAPQSAALPPPLAALAPGSPLAHALTFYAALAADTPTRVVQSAGPLLALDLHVTPLTRTAEIAAT